MATGDTLQLIDNPTRLELKQGPVWRSFEHLRTQKSAAICQELRPGHVGRLFIKDEQYVIVHVKTFNTLYGLARAAEWLSGSLILVRQAVQLVRRTDANEMAVQHLSDLVFRLTDVTGQPPQEVHDLTFNEDEQAEVSNEEFELDPAKVRRPTFARSH